MLDQLYQQYKDEPKLAGMRKGGIRFVPGQGPMNPDIMIVGEAPGGMENAKGAPFQGKAGKYLGQLLESIGLKREDIFITNSVKYWPVEETGQYRTRKPDRLEMDVSRSYLLKEIEIVNPKIVGLCGHSAITTMFPGVTEVNSVHGMLLMDKYVPLYHPAVMGYKPLISGKVKKGYKMLLEYLQEKDNAN